jgi:ArsR family transcriptional regulator
LKQLAPPAPSALAERLKVLAQPHRLQIIDLLMQGVQCNCELGEALHMAPNLISHHLGVLLKAGIVDVERDADDARWVYYSINRAALTNLNAAFSAFFNPARIHPRSPSCGPHGAVLPLDTITETAQPQADISLLAPYLSQLIQQTREKSDLSPQ